MFFAENAEKISAEKCVVTKRLKNTDGKPAEWEIVPISALDEEALRRESTVRKPIPGRRNQYVDDVDMNTYIGKLIARSVAHPNLNDAKLQTSYGANGADDLLKIMLTSGEYAELSRRVREINGYDESFDDEVDAVKN
jgi:hypothetical protein